jgi:hypothetical protein
LTYPRTKKCIYKDTDINTIRQWPTPKEIHIKQRVTQGYSTSPALLNICLDDALQESNNREHVGLTQRI